MYFGALSCATRKLRRASPTSAFECGTGGMGSFRYPSKAVVPELWQEKTDHRRVLPRVGGFGAEPETCQTLPVGKCLEKRELWPKGLREHDM